MLTPAAWASLSNETLMARFMEYSPPWSPAHAYYRLGYGWGDNWCCAEMEGGGGSGGDPGSPWSQGYWDPAGNE